MKDKLQKIVDRMGLVEASSSLGLPIKKIVDKLDLKYKTFDDLEFEPFSSGVKSIIMFDNGFGASVVRHENSYGGTKGLFELAVLDKDGYLNYDTPITDDVLGYLSPEQVTEYLFRIQDLKN